MYYLKLFSFSVTFILLSTLKCSASCTLGDYVFSSCRSYITNGFRIFDCDPSQVKTIPLITGRDMVVATFTAGATAVLGACVAGIYQFGGKALRSCGRICLAPEYTDDVGLRALIPADELLEGQNVTNLERLFGSLNFEREVYSCPGSCCGLFQYFQGFSVRPSAEWGNSLTRLELIINSRYRHRTHRVVNRNNAIRHRPGRFLIRNLYRSEDYRTVDRTSSLELLRQMELDTDNDNVNQFVVSMTYFMNAIDQQGNNMKAKWNEEEKTWMLFFLPDYVVNPCLAISIAINDSIDTRSIFSSSTDVSYTYPSDSSR